MFDTFRNHNRWLVPLVMGTATVALVGTGAYWATNFQRSTEPGIAEVDGEPVTQRDLDIAHRDRADRLAQTYGPTFDARLLDTEAQRNATLDGLLTERTLAAEARREHMGVPDSRLREVILQVPAFQVNGQFDKETYLALLRARGFTGESFDARVRADLVRQTLEGGVAASAFEPHAVGTRLAALERERRTVRVLSFPAEKALARASVDESRIQADYDAHRERYGVPESASVDLLVLRLEDIAARVNVPEADVRATYQQNLARWSAPEQRRASHILFTVGKDGSAADKEGARRLAEETLREVRAHPAEFARLARERSKDPISAARGGDLDWFGRGDMVKAFSDTAFSLKEGETSGIVESEFGLHIIRLTGVRGGKVRSFEEVRGEIEGEMRRGAAQKAYAEAAEGFSNLVYEQPDSLEGAAKKYSLPVQHFDGIGRATPLPPAISGLFPPALLEALFAPDSIARKRNTKAIEAGANTLVSARITAYKPATVRPIAEVREQILANLKREEALKLARQEGKARLEALAKSPSDAGFEPAREISRRDGAVLPQAGLVDVFSVPAASLPRYVGVDLPTGYAIVHVVSAGEGPAPPPEAITGMERALVERAGADETEAFNRALRERLGARVLVQKKTAG